MGKCKTKAIQTDLGTFRHNQAYPGIIQAYSKPCVTLAYLEPQSIQNHDIYKLRNIFRTLVYSELWHIQTQGLFRHLRRQTSTMKHFRKIAENSGKQLRNISLPRSLLHEITIMRQLLQRQLCKKAMARDGGGDIEFFTYLLIHSNKLTYLQLITVLVYGNSSPKSHEQGYLNFQQKP